MQDSPVRATIVGPGAIGGLLAAALFRAGWTVGALARGDTLATLQRDGLTVVDDLGVTGRTPLVATSDASELGEQDYVVIALKAQALPAIAARLAPLVGPRTTIVAAMNGLPWWFLHGIGGALDGHPLASVDPGGVVAAVLPPAQSIGCVVHLSSATDAPGVVRRVAGNRLIVGAPGTERAEAARVLAEALTVGGFEVETSASIRTDIWVKLWGNMNMNPLSALTGSTTEMLLDDADTQALALRMMDEATAVGQRLGLSTGMTSAERVAVTRKLGAFRTSMLQDFDAGRSPEIEPILGVFPELGRALGVPTPFCDAVLGLLRQRALNSGLYGL